MRKKKYLAIIPARRNSKRLENKNLLLINQKPMIAYTILSALKSKRLNKIIVSSEDSKILNISKKFGVDVIKRPKKLAGDTITTFQVIEHVVSAVKNFNYLVILQPTSPLRDEKHIDLAISFFEKKNADAVISVCECSHSPLWSNLLPKDRSMKNFLSKNILNKRSQDFDKYYMLNGAIYIYNIKKLLKEKSLFFKKKIFAFIMSKETSVDVDDIYDFKIAKFMLSQKNK